MLSQATRSPQTEAHWLKNFRRCVYLLILAAALAVNRLGTAYPLVYEASYIAANRKGKNGQTKWPKFSAAQEYNPLNRRRPQFRDLLDTTV